MATTLTASNAEYIPKAWESTPCLFCDHTDSFVLETFGPKERYHYVRCTGCGLTYLNPRPKYDAAFVETAYAVYTASVRDVWDGQNYTPAGTKQQKLCLKVLSQMETALGRKGSLLEVGCHTGFFCKVAREAGWSVVGIDISPTTVELAQKEFQIEAYCGDWLQVKPEQKYDAAYCSHTIEHIPNPGEWLQGFKNRLNPGGVLCLEVPNMQSIDRKFKRVLKRWGLKKDKWDVWRTPDHLYEPCERSFIPYLQRQGFQVLSVQTYSRNKPADNIFGYLYHHTLRWGSNLRVICKVA